MSRVGIGAGVLASLAAAASPSRAQVSLEFTPFLGVYAPTATLVHDGGIQCTSIVPAYPTYARIASTVVKAASPITAATACGSVLKQKIGPEVGGRVTAWVRQRIGLDVSLAYVASEVTDFTNFVTDDQAHLVTGSARLLISSVPRRRHTSFYVMGGWSLIAHKGQAYSNLTATRQAAFGTAPGTTVWAPVLGLGVRFDTDSNMAMRAGFEDYFYRFSGDAGTFTTYPNTVVPIYPARWQHDLVFSLGLRINLVPWRAGRSTTRSPSGS